MKAFLVGLTLLVLLGCAGPAPAAPVAALASTPTALAATLTPTLTASSTATPSPSPSSTGTATPAPTTTPTSTAVPTSTPTTPPTAAPRAAAVANPTIPAEVWSVGMGNELVRGSHSRAQIALTFDAGAGAEVTPPILSTLRRFGVRSTFFMTGQWARKFPDLLQEIAADGHEFGNHSDTHPDFTGLNEAEMADELARTEVMVRELTGMTTKPWFRPPFGARDGRVLAVLDRLGYRSVYWTLDSTDWRPEATGASVLKRVTENAVNGAIIVFHANGTATAEVLPQMIERLQDKGFELVKLSELAED